MLKKQNPSTNDSNKEQSTMLSESNIPDEPHAQVVANKDKQIELLSNMLE